jgi:hypothetical protein
MSGQGKVSKDIATSFVEKWNFVREDAGDQASYEHLELTIKRNKEGIHPFTAAMDRDLGFQAKAMSYRMTGQALRSITQWSGGQKTEASICEAYKKLILGLALFTMFLPR